MSSNEMDMELEAMVALSRAMSPFGEDDRPAVQRILAWFNSKYGFAGPKAVRAGTSGSPLESPATGSDDPQPSYATAADLYDAVRPEMEYEKAITVGYWLQVCNKQDNFTAQDVNGTLKHMGHGVNNITDAFNTAKDRKPALVMQTQKSGTSKQARKMYRLTTAGVRWVEHRIQGGGGNATAGKEDE
jgi:hypothetical protein